MEKIYSKLDPEVLLHVVLRKDDFLPGRQDIIPTENFLQCAILNLEKGKTFKAHRHIWKDQSKMIIAQESWYVVEGKVKCTFYDYDNKIIAEPILSAGDASFTLECGHNYEILEDNTKVLEYKTGPYQGQKMDKVFL